MWYVHKMECYSAIIKNEVLIHGKTWMNPEQLCLVKEASHKRSYIVRFHLYEMSRTGNSIETENRLILSGVGGEGNGE